MLTGAALYAGPISALVGQPRDRPHDPRVLRAAAARCRCSSPSLGRHGTRLRTDLGRLNRWSPRRRAVGSVAASATRCALGKFNPGQKLNAAFIAGAAS